MNQIEGISLNELPPTDPNHEQAAEAGSDGGGDHTLTTSDARHAEAGRRRALVLLGASISQLPIWGASGFAIPLFSPLISGECR